LAHHTLLTDQEYKYQAVLNIALGPSYITYWSGI
jgi:hypothetical protein